jgi:hypothetical protein
MNAEANLLARSAASPTLQSALYQVAARLPGPAVVPHAHDLLGRGATEVWMPPQEAVPTGTALYFNSSTGAVLDVGSPRPNLAVPGHLGRCLPGFRLCRVGVPVSGRSGAQASADTSVKRVPWLRCPTHIRGDGGNDPVTHPAAVNSRGSATRTARGRPPAGAHIAVPAGCEAVAVDADEANGAMVTVFTALSVHERRFGRAGGRPNVQSRAD